MERSANDPAAALIWIIKEHDPVVLTKAVHETMPHRHRLLDTVYENEITLPLAIHPVWYNKSLEVQFSFERRHNRIPRHIIFANCVLPTLTVCLNSLRCPVPISLYLSAGHDLKIFPAPAH